MSQRLRGVELERERARVIAEMNALPRMMLEYLSPIHLVNLFKAQVGAETVMKFKRTVLKSRSEETNDMQGKFSKDALLIRQQMTLENIAAWVTKSGAYCGDAETVGSEDTLKQVIRELRYLDSSILARNAKKKPKERKALLPTAP